MLITNVIWLGNLHIYKYISRNIIYMHLDGIYHHDLEHDHNKKQQHFHKHIQQTNLSFSRDVLVGGKSSPHTNKTKHVQTYNIVFRFHFGGPKQKPCGAYHPEK